MLDIKTLLWCKNQKKVQTKAVMANFEQIFDSETF